MTIEVLIALISGLVAILIAAITYVQAKRITFFETFFNRKADVFEEFINKISSIPRTEDELYMLSSTTRKVVLYCFETHKHEILNLLDLMIKLYQMPNDSEMFVELVGEFREKRKCVIDLLRTEIQQSKKWKFQK